MTQAGGMAVGMAASIRAAADRASSDPGAPQAPDEAEASSELNIAVRAASIQATDDAPEGGADRELVDKARRGDNGAFRILVTRYQRRVYNVAYGMVRNHEDAMDVAQESFIKVHRYLANFQGSSSFYTWLYRIVVNVGIDHIRKGKGQQVLYDDRMAPEDRVEGDGSLLPSILGSDPAKALGRAELLEMMQKALDTLPPYHRAVIVMRELEGMSYKDMARAMKVSKGTIMSRLHHARHKLQKALADYVQGKLTVD